MPNVDFYLLDETNLTQAEMYVCRLLDKIFNKGHQVYVQVNNAADAMRLDELLWTYQDISFTPHSLDQVTTTPIQIGYENIPAKQQDILLNFSNRFPESITQFKRILEVVPNQANLKDLARLRYKQYKDQGCELKLV